MLRSTCILLFLFYLFNSGATSSPSVIIIGAGPSGIAAATRLLENSINNITILEAESRIGGRINTVYFNGALVEVGAEYCHGEKGNIVYELTKNYNVLGPSLNPFSNGFYSNGSAIDPKLLEELGHFFDKYPFTHDGYNTTGRSVADVFTYRYRSKFFQKYRNDRRTIEILEDALRLMEFWILASEGSFSWLDPSFERDAEECEGDQSLIWTGRGYKTILDILMKKYPDRRNQLPIDDKIQFNKKVTKVFWKGKDTPSVLTSDQSTYKADYVIFTPSVGVLKAEKNKLFEPKLPLLKQAAIVATGFGGVMKLIMYFPDIWWKSDDYAFEFIYSKQDLNHAEFSGGPRRGGRSWVTHFVTMTRPYASVRVWIGWIVGDVVPEVERLSEATLKRGAKYVLDKFLSKRYNVTDIGEIMISTWCSNDNFRGTYSFTKTGLYRKDLPYQNILAQPLGTDDGTPSLLFAGEATSQHHYATVHGAIETGHREADRIINIHRNN